MTDTYTTTLVTGQTLAITTRADFGETIMAALLLSLLVVLVLSFIWRVTHGRHR
ncbi:MAG: hypothetical protein HC875_16995 [Anaerolineales bacterium]|nr:hypothetical protein [Anaerolineales bacterium]